MESLYLVSSRPLTAPSRAPVDFHYHRSSSLLPTKIPVLESTRFGRRGGRRTQFLVSAFGRSGCGESRRLRTNDVFASISRNNETAQTSSVGNPPLSVPASPSSVGSPLFWIGVGVGFSVLFSWVANYLKKYAMQQAFKAMMAPLEQEKGPLGNDPFGNPTMFPGSMFPAPPGSPSTNRTPPPRATHQPVTTTDVVATKVEPASEVETPTSSKEIKLEDDATQEPKKYAFVDVAPEDVSSAGSAEGFRYPDEVRPPNGSAINQDKSDTFKQSDSQQSPLLSVEALEKMMEDPTVQKMVYPYLPEEMRNPSTFKWMMQNPQYREQLQDMLNNMGGSSEWDGQLLNSLKNFDLSSPEVKQQFDQIGLTPEEVISKIMANPDVAMSFQNPKVQAAIIDCSQNPLNIRKYQDDQEVMDVFSKISELFPEATGSY